MQMLMIIEGFAKNNLNATATNIINHYESLYSILCIVKGTCTCVTYLQYYIIIIQCIQVSGVKLQYTVDDGRLHCRADVEKSSYQTTTNRKIGHQTKEYSGINMILHTNEVFLMYYRQELHCYCKFHSTSWFEKHLNPTFCRLSLLSRQYL